jgi:AraC family transcriptional regulator, transcriptional activator of pobA
MSRIHNIPAFLKYLNIAGLKNEDLHIVDFRTQNNLLLKSGPVTIDFYLLAIKPPINKSGVNPFPKDAAAETYMYLDCPHNSIEWDIDPPLSGYSIMVSPAYLNKLAKDYSFMHYNNHEALFLNKEEESVMLDLFTKAYNEFQKDYYSKDVILSYITLLFTYTQIYYNRQFDTRSKIYHKVIEEFHQNLENYFERVESVPGLPSVAFFAEQANLSANYFGDLIKHFTGEPPIEHIHNYIIKIAKQKLQQTDLSISQISFSLGFDYPTYFTRFFRKKTGISPRVFRNQ